MYFIDPAHSWPPPSIPAEGIISASLGTILLTLNPNLSLTASVALITPKSGPCPKVIIGYPHLMPELHYHEQNHRFFQEQGM